MSIIGHYFEATGGDGGDGEVKSVKSKIADVGGGGVRVVLERSIAGQNSPPNAFDNGMEVLRCPAERYWLSNRSAAE
jgi:hypothetical protein